VATPVGHGTFHRWENALGHAINLGLVSFALWLLLSGHGGILLLAGVISCIFVVWIALRMDVVDHEAYPLDLRVHAVLLYWAWLVREIIVANLRVTRLILDPKLPITPTITRVKTSQRGVFGQVTYANSITLTPGTVSIDLSDGEIEVHALTREAAAELETGEMDRRVTRLEGDR